jgi:hypothetical protein
MTTPRLVLLLQSSEVEGAGPEIRRVELEPPMLHQATVTISNMYCIKVIITFGCTVLLHTVKKSKTDRCGQGFLQTTA